MDVAIAVGVVIFIEILVLAILSGFLINRKRAEDSVNMNTKIDATNRKADRIERKLDGTNNHLCKELRSDIEQVKLQLNDVEKEANEAKHGAKAAETNAYDSLQVAQEVRDRLPAPRKRDEQGKFLSE